MTVSSHYTGKLDKSKAPDTIEGYLDEEWGCLRIHIIGKRSTKGGYDLTATVIEKPSKPLGTGKYWTEGGIEKDLGK